VSVDRIARAAEVNKTSVYRRWPTRDALIAAALERVVVDVNAHIEDTGSLRGDLHVLAHFVAGLLEQPLGRAIARAALDDASSPTLKAMAARQLEQQAHGPMAELIARARARGEWSLDAPPDLVPSMLAGALLHRVLLERRALTPAFLTSVIDVLLLGVMPRASLS
jgi:AcrR family transcriptional regulator